MHVYTYTNRQVWYREQAESAWFMIGQMTCLAGAMRIGGSVFRAIPMVELISHLRCFFSRSLHLAWLISNWCLVSWACSASFWAFFLKDWICWLKSSRSICASWSCKRYIDNYVLLSLQDRTAITKVAQKLAYWMSQIFAHTQVPHSEGNSMVWADLLYLTSGFEIDELKEKLKGKGDLKGLSYGREYMHFRSCVPHS